MNKIEKYAGAIALALLLIPQMQHTVYVFTKNSHYENVWFAWSYALGIDLAILIFTLKGWTWVAIGYLVATLATNIIYQFYPIGSEAKILISTLLAFTIFIFSHLYKRQKEDKQEASDDILKEMKAIGVAVQFSPHQCPACGKAFQSSKELNGHISGHKSTKQGIAWNPVLYGDWEKQNAQRAKFIEQNNKKIQEILLVA